MTHAATIPVPAAKESLPDIRDKDTGSEPARPGFALKNLNFRKLLMAGAAFVVLAGAVNYGWDYWTVGQYLVSTDDAYVKADNTTVAPKISGYLHEVLVGDNERVKAGQVLARIDQRDFRGGARPGQGRRRRSARCDRKQAGATSGSAGGNRCRKGDRGRRSGGGDLCRAGEQALHGSGDQWLRQRAERAAGAVAHRRRPGRDRARHRQPCLRAETGRPAQGR